MNEMNAERGGLERALELVGDRWSLLVIEAVAAGTERFGDLGERLGIATNILVERLRRLERAGLVIATPYQRRPLRVQYTLTDEGRRLAGAIAELAAWGAEREGLASPARRHELCGTPLVLRSWCPTCDRAVDDADDDPSDGLVWV